MTRKLAALVLSASVLVTLGACSKNDTTATTPATTAASGSGNNSSATTAKSGGDSPATTAKKSTGTTKAGSSKMPSTKNIELTSEEESCADALFSQYAADNPQSSDAETAGALGASIVKCTTKAKVADSIIAGLKDSNAGKSITSEQATCMRDKVISLDSDQLSTVLGVFIYAGATLDLSAAVQILGSLAQACDVTLSS